MKASSPNHWTTREFPKIDFKIKTVTGDKEQNYIMITESIQEEDITLVINIYAQNIGTPQYIRKMLTDIKG